MKTFLNLAAAALMCASASQAVAALSFSQSSAVPGVYTAPIFSTFTPALAYAANDSLTDVRLAPLGSSGNYLAISTGGAATVDLGGASGFSFLWGSPDLYNFITLVTSSGVESFSGLDFQSLFGLSANGANANTRWFGILGSAGQTLTSISFASAGNAFEVAVTSPVPEPEKYALLLAGVGIVFFVSRRVSNRERI